MKQSPDSTIATPTNPVNRFCTGCGACVSESQDSLEMGWNSDGFLAPRLRVRATGKLDHANAIRVCPFNPQPEDAVRDEDVLGRKFLSGTSHASAVAGGFERTYAGYSHQFRSSGSSGGIATYVFRELLSRGIVDRLFTVTPGGKDTYQYAFIGRDDDFSTISKTRYYPVTLDELFRKVAESPGRIAVSGVACFVKAIRLKQHYHADLRDKIPFLVGIICGGLKSRFYTDFLAQMAGIDGAYSQPEYRIKDPHSTASDYSFGALDQAQRAHQVKMRKIGDVWGTGLFKAQACDLCTDVFTELADISVGDAWIAPYRQDGRGNSVVVTRTALADQIIQEGVRDGALNVTEVPLSQITQSQASSIAHRQWGVGVRLATMDAVDQRLPHVRPRMLRDVPWLFALVQRQREVTRSRSFRYWREFRKAGLFARRMRKHVKWLKVLTRVYRTVHRGRP
jgi:coenzyme F420 hydrogenase subunit beta